MKRNMKTGTVQIVRDLCRNDQRQRRKKCDPEVTRPVTAYRYSRAMKAMRLDFGVMTSTAGGFRRGLRLATPAGVRGPEKYRILDLKRRRAQIRARRELGLP